MGTAAGVCSGLGLQPEQMLGMRAHCPTPYKPAPEILPAEGFCLCTCAGKQEEVRALQGTEGKHRWRFCPRPPQPSQGCSRTVQHSVPYTAPLQAFAVLCPAARRAFPPHSKEPAAQLRARAAEQNAWPVTHGKSRAMEPQRNSKDELPREPPALPLRDTQLRAGEKLLVVLKTAL